MFHHNGRTLLRRCLGIESKSTLITSHFDEETIQKECEKVSLKIIPKSLLPYVPISLVDNYTYNYDMILIDDDPLVCLCWESEAESKDVKIKTFSSPDDFLDIAANIDPDTHIYLDSHFGKDAPKGEDIAKIINEKYGYCNIGIQTGHDPEDIVKASYIRGVVGKDPNF